VISNLVSWYIANPIADSLRLPFMMLLATPTIIPNPHLPPYLVHHSSLGLGILNLLAGELVLAAVAASVTNIRDIHQIQQEAGGAPCDPTALLRRNIAAPLLLGYSAVLGSCPPLPGHRCIPCGALTHVPSAPAFDPAAAPGAAALAAFLAAGEPPVLVGWGSMAGWRPGLTRLAVRALLLSGQRGVLQAWQRAGHPWTDSWREID
jgi:hypothetical protein